MPKNYISFLLSFAILLVATSCGGGGGGGEGDTPSNSNIILDESDLGNDEYLQSGGLDQVNANSAYILNATGSGIKVAVVDTGVNSNHIELQGQVLESSWRNLYAETTGDNTAICSNSNVVCDDEGHGSHVAGIIAGKKNNLGMHGIAYDAKIIPVKVLNDEGAGYITDIAYGIAHAVNEGADVINLSLGYYPDPNTFFDSNTQAGMEDIILAASIDYATSNGTIIVAAAGNEGYVDPVFPAWYAGIDVITNDLLIAVGSVDANNVTSYFSNGCGIAKDFCLVAPGENIISVNAVNNDGGVDNEGYLSASGTSMATPHVSGAVALLLGAFPSLTPQQVVERILTTATDLGVAGIDDIYGHGLLNIDEAMNPAGSLSIVSGSNVLSFGNNVANSSLNLSTMFGNSFKNNAIFSKVMAVDEFYQRAYYVDLNNYISSKTSKSSYLDDFLLSDDKKNKYAFTNVDLGNGGNLSFIIHNEDNSVNEYTGQMENREERYIIKDITTDNNSSDVDNVAFSQRIGDTEVELSHNKSFTSDHLGNGESNISLVSTSQGNANSTSFMSLTGDDNNNIKISRNLSDNLKFYSYFSDGLKNGDLAQEYTSSNNYEYETKTLLSGLSYDNKKGSGFSVSFGNLNEDNALLGSTSSGAMDLAESSDSRFFEVSFTNNFAKDFYLFGSYSEAISSVAEEEGSIFANYDDLRSRGFSLGLMKNSSDNKLGFVYSEPLRVYSGYAYVDVPVARDNNGNVIRQAEKVSMIANGKQQNFEMFYNKSFTQQNFDSALGINFAYILEKDNIKDNDEGVVALKYMVKY